MVCRRVGAVIAAAVFVLFAAAVAPGAAFASAASAAPAGASPRGPVVYLTFDDGPHPRHTPEVLGLLKRYDARATFFMVGTQARRYPGLVDRVRAHGHAVGNHSFSHSRLTLLPAGLVADELRATALAVGGTSCMRPPFGDISPRVRTIAERQRQRVVLWTVDPRDWTRPGAQVIAQHALRDVRPGSTLLLHDGGGDRAQTVEALDLILSGLTDRGYRFAAIPGCR